MHKIAILLSQLDVRTIFLIKGSVRIAVLILPARCFFITSYYYNTTNCECQALYMLLYKKIISRFSEESRDISYFIMNKFPKVAVLIEKKNQLLFDVDTTLSTKVSSLSSRLGNCSWSSSEYLYVPLNVISFVSSLYE